MTVGVVVAVSLMYGEIRTRSAAVFTTMSVKNLALEAKDTQEAAINFAATAESKRLHANMESQLAIAREADALAVAGLAEEQEALAVDAIRRAFVDTGLVPVGNSPHDLAYDGSRLWMTGIEHSVW
jgi:hypothetical protein